MQLDSFTRFSYPLNFWNQLNLFFIFLADNIFKNFLITRKLVRSSYIIVLLFIKVEFLDKLNFRFLISISSNFKFLLFAFLQAYYEKGFFFCQSHFHWALDCILKIFLQWFFSFLFYWFLFVFLWTLELASLSIFSILPIFVFIF